MDALIQILTDILKGDKVSVGLKLLLIAGVALMMGALGKFFVKYWKDYEEKKKIEDQRKVIDQNKEKEEQVKSDSDKADEFLNGR